MIPATPAAEQKVQNALAKIESAQRLLGDACAELSPVVGAAGDWKRVGALYDRVHEEWRKLAYDAHNGWRLDSEAKNEVR